MDGEKPEKYDVAVIGTGPAGISAAITLTVRNKRIVLFGNANLSDKIEKAHSILNYPGLPAITGTELQQRFKNHLDSLGIKITESHIAACYASSGAFSLVSNENVMYGAGAVILASGVSFGKPYSGETEFLGRGVSYCATCDAPLYRGKTVVVIGQNQRDEREAAFVSELCKKVYYVPLYDGDNSVGGDIEVVRDVPVAFTGTAKAQSLVLKNRTIEADGFFILRDSVSPGTLVPGLKLDGNHVAVGKRFETNIAGCFACGDIAGAPYQFVKAAGEGNAAALSAVEYLAAQKSGSTGA